MLVLKQRLWLTEDRSRVVNDGDPEAVHFLGAQVDEAEAERLGLTDDQVERPEPQATTGLGVPAAKAEAKPAATKAQAKPEATKSHPAPKGKK
jgi:hypothetical protein